MCGIAGIVRLSHAPLDVADLVSFYRVAKSNAARGRDSFGFTGFTLNQEAVSIKKGVSFDMSREQFLNWAYSHQLYGVIANFRGEPTTEFIKNKEHKDVQPFGFNDVFVTHNGTISNDKELLENSPIKGIFKPGEHIIDSYAIIEAYLTHGKDFVNHIQGSFALALVDAPLELKYLYLVRNYRSLYAAQENNVIVWSSLEKPIKMNFDHFKELKIPPYTGLMFKYPGSTPRRIIIDDVRDHHSAIVICSGGLDSTTAAKIACIENKRIKILHFTYGCLAESREKTVVRKIHERLVSDHPDKDISLQFFDTNVFKQIGHSTLIDNHEKIADGDKGVETHNEWVPARNLVMISIAAALCDAENYTKIYLGLNMEEGSAYPDNTIEFYEKLSDSIAVGTISRPEIINPLANSMKHEIVKMALEINAPIELSWSCYRNGEEHCGTCGPCTMRKAAFEKNGLVFA